MNLRRLTWISVLLACSLAVFAAPVTEPASDSDVEAREWDASDLSIRDTVNDAFLEARYFAFHENRAKTPKVSPPKSEPKPKPAPKPAPPPKKPDPKKPDPKKPDPKPAPPKKPVPKTPPPKKPDPKNPPPKKPNPKSPPPKKGQCDAKPKGGKGKRAFQTDCDKNSLTLSGVTRAITKVTDQGNSALTYKVDGGWPDPSTNKDVTAYAKTGKRPGTTFAEEAKWLKHTDQLLAEGQHEGHNFIVFHGVDGKVKIHDTDFFMGLYQHMHKGDVKKCEDEVKKKLDLVVKEAKTYVDKYGILHTDIQPGNILWDKAATDPTLIDWGRAKDVGVGKWSTELESQVRKQAEFSHLQGEEKLCHDLKP